MPPFARAALREPVLHFLLAGAVLFCLDAAIGGDDAADASTPPAARASAPDARIVVDDDVRAEIVDGWRRVHGVDPSPEELERLVDDWTRDEILYREGLVRGIDRDDPRVRARIAQQMAFILRAAVVVPDPSDEELRAFFHAHEDRYAEPERVDFTHVFVGGTSDASRRRAEDLLVQVRGGASPAALGDTFSGGRRYRRRTVEDLMRTFGEAFVSGLAEQAPDVWELRASRFGFHLVRIDEVTGARAPSYAASALDVRRDWEESKRDEGVARAMEQLRERWHVVVDR